MRWLRAGWDFVLSAVDLQPIPKRAWLALVSLLVITLSLLFLTNLRILQMQSGYRIDALEREQDELLAKKRALLLEQAVQRRPERIESRAQKELNFVYPNPNQIWKMPGQ